MPATADTPRPVHKSRRTADDDDFDEVPRKKKRRKKADNTMLYVVIAGGGAAAFLLLAVAGGVLWYILFVADPVAENKAVKNTDAAPKEESMPSIFTWHPRRATAAR